MNLTKKLIAIFAMITTLLISVFANFSYAADTFTKNNTITISIPEGIEGERTYTAYKILQIPDDATKTDSNFKYFFESQEKFEEIRRVLSDITSTGITQNSTEGDVIKALGGLQNNSEDLYTFSQNLDASKFTGAQSFKDENATKISVQGNGYYLIVENTADNVTPKSRQHILANVIGDETINIKAENIPAPEKKLINENDNTASVGEYVGYEITSEIPDVSKYTTYQYDLVDTATNQKIEISKDNPLTVKIVDPETNADTTIATFDGTTNTISNIKVDLNNEGTNLTVHLGDYLIDNKGNNAGKKFSVTYKAQILSSAIEKNIATNSVKLVYNNDTSNPQDGTEVPGNEVTVFTYNVEFTKKQTTGATLEGAVFELYKNEYSENSSPLAFDENGNYDENGVTSFTTGENGKIIFKGLDAGKYILHEVTAPSGFEKMDYTFTISEVNTKDSLNEATLTATPKSDFFDITNGTIKITGKDQQTFTANIINTTEKSSLLPTTGGIGTKIFTVVGILVMAGAVIAIIAYNKKH